MVTKFSKNVNGQACANSIFSFNNCQFHCHFGGENIKLNIEQKQITDIYSVAKYTIRLQERVRALIQEDTFFNIKEENNIRFFSFTSAKLQKLIIISLLEYLRRIKFEKTNISTSEAVEYNPINDLNFLINIECGFSIEYDFMKLGLNPVYNKLIQGDKSVSLFDYKSNNYNNDDVLHAISNLNIDNSIDNLLFSCIPHLLKRTIAETVAEFILYPACEIGSRLNRLKQKSWEKDNRLTLATVFDSAYNKFDGMDCITYLCNTDITK